MCMDRVFARTLMEYMVDSRRNTASACSCSGIFPAYTDVNASTWGMTSLGGDVMHVLAVGYCVRLRSRANAPTSTFGSVPWYVIALVAIRIQAGRSSCNSHHTTNNSCHNKSPKPCMLYNTAGISNIACKQQH